MSTTETKSAHGWSKAKLADLLTVLRGVTYKKEHASKEPRTGLLPILRANNIQNGLVFEDLVYVPKDCVSETQMLRSGDIVIAASSGSRHIVGKAAQLTTDWRGSFGTFCFGLRPKPGVHPGYLAWFLQTSEYRHQFSELSAEVNINNLRATHIEEIPISVAPLPEQRRIVAEIEKQFTRLEAGVAALRRVQANLKRYRAAVLKAACEGRLVPTEAELCKVAAASRRSPAGKQSRDGSATFETGAALLVRILTERRQNWQGRGKYKEPTAPDTANLPQLPAGWTWATVEQLAVIGSGNTPANITDVTSAKGDVPWFKVGDMNHPENTRVMRVADNYLSEEAVENLGLRLFPPGTILFPKRGGAIATNKKRLLETKATTDLNVMGLTASSELAPYFWWWFSSINLASFSDGSNVPQVNNKDICPIPIPLPPLAEQTRIVAEVERRLSVVEELEAVVSANLQRATRLRQSILQKAFTGSL